MPDNIEEYKDIEIAPVEEVKPPEGYTAQEWGGLTEAEKAVAMDEIAHPEGEKPPEMTDDALKAIAGEEDEAKKKADEEAAASKADAEAADKAEAEKATPPEPEKPMTDEELLAHRFNIELKIDPDETVPIPDDLQEKLDTLDEKFEQGDIDQKEYNKQTREIDRQATARFMAQKEGEKGDLLWNNEQGLFLRSRTEYLGEKQADGTFDKTEKSDMLWGALAGVVKNLQAKDPNLKGMRLLIEADKRVKAMFAPKEAALPKKEEPPAKKDEKPPAKMPDDFVTLGDIATAGKNTTDGTFDQLDKLSGKRTEEYMKKHPELVDRYIDDLR